MTRQAITIEAARRLAEVAQSMCGRGLDPLRAALAFLNEPTPTGQSNSDVLVPWGNGRDVSSTLPMSAASA